jgi:hypothetical protein
MKSPFSFRYEGIQAAGQAPGQRTAEIDWSNVAKPHHNLKQRANIATSTVAARDGSAEMIKDIMLARDTLKGPSRWIHDTDLHHFLLAKLPLDLRARTTIHPKAKNHKSFGLDKGCIHDVRCSECIFVRASQGCGVGGCSGQCLQCA